MRSKFTKIKTAKGRKISSTRWLQRQLNDQFVIKAQQEGYKSRAAYKLLQINEKFKIISPGMKILDLGAAPGGWTQVAVELSKSKIKSYNSSVVAIDLLEMNEIEGAIISQKDFYDEDAAIFIKNLFSLDQSSNNFVDLVMSDMAANTTGHAPTDHLRIMDLCERVVDFAVTILKPNGSLIMKIFQGGAEKDLLMKIKKHFKLVKHFKPSASRADSAEIYLVAKNFRISID